MLQQGADVCRRISKYGDAVQTASITNDWMIVKILSNFGADVDPEDFSIGGPYNDPWIAQSNKDSLTEEEVARVSSSNRRIRYNLVKLAIPVTFPITENRYADLEGISATESLRRFQTRPPPPKPHVNGLRLFMEALRVI